MITSVHQHNTKILEQHNCTASESSRLIVNSHIPVQISRVFLYDRMRHSAPCTPTTRMTLFCTACTRPKTQPHCLRILQADHRCSHACANKPCILAQKDAPFSSLHAHHKNDTILYCLHVSRLKSQLSFLCKQAAHSPRTKGYVIEPHECSSPSTPLPSYAQDLIFILHSPASTSSSPFIHPVR